MSGRVVDADGHVLEPADTWLRHLDPSYRDRAIRIAHDEDGYEVLLIDGQPLKTLRGELGALGSYAATGRGRHTVLAELGGTRPGCLAVRLLRRLSTIPGGNSV